MNILTVTEYSNGTHCWFPNRMSDFYDIECQIFMNDSFEGRSSLILSCFICKILSAMFHYTCSISNHSTYSLFALVVKFAHRC